MSRTAHLHMYVCMYVCMHVTMYDVSRYSILLFGVPSFARAYLQASKQFGDSESQKRRCNVGDINERNDD